MMGTCSGCGAENVELNEEGKCANCAAAATPEAPAGDDTGGDTPTGGETPAV